MEYDVKAFIEKYRTLDSWQIVAKLTVEVTNLEQEWRYAKKNTAEYHKLERYKDCADTLLSYINIRKIPAPKEAKDMQIFLPIIQSLVDKGQISKIMVDQIRI